MVLLEVLCGRPALDFTLDEDQQSLAVWATDCIREGNIDRIIDPCLRGQTRAKFLKEFGRISYECLLARSKDRPTMTKVLARLELVLAWTLQSGPSGEKHVGRSIFIEKAWSLFPMKVPKGRTSSPTKNLGHSMNNKKQGTLIEKHATMVVEGGCQSGGIATASRQLVLPTGQTKITILKMFTFSELQSATRNFVPDMFIGEGVFGKVFKGWLDSVTFVQGKVGGGLAVAIKRSSPDSFQGLNEFQGVLTHIDIFSKLPGKAFGCTTSSL
ncbi:hypothetical protein L2E82_07760 [Cichorium intybus]|uniref:Uncharacterized protein n=1 Tax=Cichorium intybus TaxID=13427 RepID=A0ACB9G5I3_CICIN|nr:hypothetical protein L2E82_07760 [Cichorium intybus]